MTISKTLVSELDAINADDEFLDTMGKVMEGASVNGETKTFLEKNASDALMIRKEVVQAANFSKLKEIRKLPQITAVIKFLSKIRVDPSHFTSPQKEDSTILVNDLNQEAT